MDPSNNATNVESSAAQSNEQQIFINLLVERFKEKVNAADQRINHALLTQPALMGDTEQVLVECRREKGRAVQELLRGAAHAKTPPRVVLHRL